MTDDPEIERQASEEAERYEKEQRREGNTRAVVERDYIQEAAVEHWRRDSLDFYLVPNPGRIRDEMLSLLLPFLKPSPSGKWNGYVRFPKTPGVVSGRDGIYKYVTVHGGITFFQEWADGSCTFGFDTSHSFSDPRFTDDHEWMVHECEAMARGIMIAARFEPYYLRAGENNDRKLRVLERMRRFIPFDPDSNLGIMLNLLDGNL